MRTTRHVFREVAIFMEKRAKCTACGKRRQRRKKFWQTINPWNVDSAGVPKSAALIREQEFAKAKAWAAGPFLCATCEDAAMREGGA